MKRTNLKLALARSYIGALAFSPLMAFAQSSGSFTGGLCKALTLMTGNSPLVAFVAGAAVIVFLIVFSLNEGNNAFVSWGLKILIGVSGLIGMGSLLNMLFGISLSC